MPSFGASITFDDATPALELLASHGFLQDEKTMRGTAEVAEAVVQQYLGAKDASDPHKSATSLGAKKTGLYGSWARGMTNEVRGSLILLIINDPAARQRFKGGDIEPVNGKKLAIPARAEMYGHSPKEFPREMFVPVFGRNGIYGLAQAVDTHRILQSGKRAGHETKAHKDEVATLGAGAILFWLVDHVHQDADESVLPRDEQLATAVVQYLEGEAGEAIQTATGNAAP
jgi:hypothetical protein